MFSIRRPHGTATFLVDGVVRGEWRFEDGRVVLEPFEPLDPGVRRPVAAEAERLRAFHVNGGQ